MDSAERENLRSVVAVALACAPRRLKKQFADQYDAATSTAQRQLSEAVTEALVEYLDRKSRPHDGVGFMSRLPDRRG